MKDCTGFSMQMYIKQNALLNNLPTCSHLLQDPYTAVNDVHEKADIKRIQWSM